MKYKNDIDKIMESIDIQVDADMRENILNQTTRKKTEKKVLLGMRKKVAVLALAGVLCIGTVAVAANEIPKLWDKTVARLFNVGEVQQEKLVDEGYAKVLEAKDSKEEVLTHTENGITITAKHTISDKYGLYVYLNVKSNDGVKLTKKNIGFEECDIKINGDIYCYDNSGSGFIEKEYAISDYERGYEFYCTNYVEKNIEGKEIQIELKNLTYDETNMNEEVLVEGTWKLKWIGKGCADSKTIKLNNTYTEKGVDIKLKTFEITPISYTLNYDCPNWDNFEDDESAYIPFKIVMKDGKKYGNMEDTEQFFGGPGMAGSQFERYMVDKVLDIDNIAYVEVGGTRYEVE